MNLNDRILREEAKRNRCWHPERRWEDLQRAIASAGQQLEEPRNTPASQHRTELRLLGKT